MVWCETAGGLPGVVGHVDLLATVDLPHGGAVVRGLWVQELVLLRACSVVSGSTLLVDRCGYNYIYEFRRFYEYTYSWSHTTIERSHTFIWKSQRPPSDSLSSSCWARCFCFTYSGCSSWSQKEWPNLQRPGGKRKIFPNESYSNYIIIREIIPIHRKRIIYCYC